MMSEEIKKFVGKKVYSDGCGNIFGLDSDGGSQLLLNVRGYGAIQCLFKNSKGEVDLDKVDEFHNQLTNYFVSLINDKL